MHPFLRFASLPPARHPKPPGLNLQHQLPTCALYALHASMNDVPSHVRQGPTFEHACTFVNVCVQRWLGGDPVPTDVLVSSHPRVSSQLRRAAHQEPGGGPVQPKQKQSPFASRSVQRALLKRRRACKRGSGYRRGKERVKSSLSATAGGRGGEESGSYSLTRAWMCARARREHAGTYSPRTTALSRLGGGLALRTASWPPCTC